MDLIKQNKTKIMNRFSLMRPTMQTQKNFFLFALQETFMEQNRMFQTAKKWFGKYQNDTSE
jgi:hypothetical protein